jgi:hypothetical protein
MCPQNRIISKMAGAMREVEERRVTKVNVAGLGDSAIYRYRSLYGCGLTVPSQVGIVVMLTRIMASSKEQKLRTPETFAVVGDAIRL